MDHMLAVFFHGSNPEFKTPTRAHTNLMWLERKVADYEDLLETDSTTPRARVYLGRALELVLHAVNARPEEFEAALCACKRADEDVKAIWQRTFGDTEWAAQIDDRMDILAAFVQIQLYDDWMPMYAQRHPRHSTGGAKYKKTCMDIGKGLSYPCEPENPSAALVKLWETVAGTAREMLLDHNVLIKELRDFYDCAGQASSKVRFLVEHGWWREIASKIVRDREDARKVFLYKEVDDGHDSDPEAPAKTKERRRFKEVMSAIGECEKKYFKSITSAEEYEVSDLAEEISASKFMRCPAIEMR